MHRKSMSAATISYVGYPENSKMGDSVILISVTDETTSFRVGVSSLVDRAAPDSKTEAFATESRVFPLVPGNLCEINRKSDDISTAPPVK